VGRVLEGISDAQQIDLPWYEAPQRDDRHNRPDAHLSHGTDFSDPVDWRRAALVFVRHPRARRYVIRVTEAGTVRVTIPPWGSKREAQAFADRERAWIDKQWARHLDLRGESERADGQREREAQETRDARDARDRLDRERARRELPVRLMELAGRLGFAPDAITKISVRNQQWRWGSCSPNGHICLNWRLVTMPDQVRDYVLIHELMHLKRMDHSPKFWKLVAQACPDYQEARARLRAYVR
jgi:predicted metal-dependent hydrolase